MITNSIDQQVQTGNRQLSPDYLNYIEAASIAPIEVSSQYESRLILLQIIHRADIWRLLYCQLLKRCFDLSMALILIIALSPLMLLIALLLHLESQGPVIFRQQRIGLYGRSFTIYKYRTMIADRRRQNLPFEGQNRRECHKTPHDPRITRFGKFLRKTSLDELPQLFNILCGTMSFIGPRPELPEIVSHYEPWQHRRHLVLPGLSGWWQIQGRSDLPMHEHTELDIYYVLNQSFWLDLQIALQTFRILLSRSGAFSWLTIVLP